MRDLAQWSVRRLQVHISCCATRGVESGTQPLQRSSQNRELLPSRTPFHSPTCTKQRSPADRQKVVSWLSAVMWRRARRSKP